MTYPETVKYLDSFINYEKVPLYLYQQSISLERVAGLLKILGNPQDDLRCIHIAGTKGKGSTCAFIAYILRELEFRVGLYTSPHLSDFRERIRILGPSPGPRAPQAEFKGIISRQGLINIVERLKPSIEKFNAQSKYGAPSFFEVYTALAFMYFREKQVDFAVLETGLGGRLDATNTANSLICAITPISYEHTELLGRTLTEVAFEKAGIIKTQDARRKTQDEIVITAPQEKEVIEVIRNRCRRQGATLYEVGKDITFQAARSPRGDQYFNIDGVLGRLTDLRIRLLGRHQIVNATLAAAVVLALGRFFSVRLNLEAIRNGLYNTIWPGRFEVIQGRPQIVLDGAQNLASAQVLKEAIIENFPGRRITLVLGISQDKDIKGICQMLIPISKKVILTQVDNPRAASVDMIEQIICSQFSVLSCQLFKVRKVKEAMELAQKRTRPEGIILVTGSLFLVGEARDLLKRQ